MKKVGSITPKAKKQRVSGLLQLLIIVGFLALIWFSFGQNVLPQQKPMNVPEQLGTLELVSSFEGLEALAQINELHGTDISLLNAYTAVYAHSNKKVTVWVGRSESSDAAARLTRIMADGIARGNPEFGNLQQLTIADHDIYQVEGAGGKHYFYQSEVDGDTVVWLSIEADDTVPILEQTIKYF